MLTVDFSKIDIYQVIKDNYDDERIQKVLASLPENEREVLELRIGIKESKLSRQKIADRLGVTLDMVRGMEYRALRRLKHPARVQMLNAVLDPNFHISDKVQEFYNQANKKM